MDLKESWGYLAPWGVALAAIIAAVRQTYAAERDREALKNANLEREKLALEVNRLRNSPEAVKDRRELYDKLRQQVQAITGSASAEASQIIALQELKHDSAYRFPSEVITALEQLIESVGTLCWTGHQLRKGSEGTTYERREKTIKTNSDALMQVVRFEQSMVDLFKPYLTL